MFCLIILNLFKKQRVWILLRFLLLIFTWYLKVSKWSFKFVFWNVTFISSILFLEIELTLVLVFFSYFAYLLLFGCILFYLFLFSIYLKWWLILNHLWLCFFNFVSLFFIIKICRVSVFILRILRNGIISTASSLAIFVLFI